MEPIDAQSADFEVLATVHQKKYKWNVREMTQSVYQFQRSLGFGLYEKKFEQTTLEGYVTDAEICPTCGRENACGMAKGEATCWCFTMPRTFPVKTIDKGARCYCRACLARKTTDRTAATSRSDRAQP